MKPVNDQALSLAWKEWLDSLSLDERQQMAEQGLTGHQPANHHGNTSPEIARWLGTKPEDNDDDQQMVSVLPELSVVLLDLAGRQHPGHDIVCLLTVLNHPAVQPLTDCARLLLMKPQSLKRRGKRVLEMLDSLSCLDRTRAWLVLEMLAFVANRPKPRMSIYCVLRACGETAGGQLTLEEIAAQSGVTKQNAHREVKVIKMLFGLQDHKTRYEKDAKTRLSYIDFNCRNPTTEPNQ